MTVPYDLKALFEEAFKKTPHIKLRMKGKSMYPILKDGETHTVAKKAIEEIKEGDIVVYQKLYSQQCRCYAHLVLKRIGRESLYFVVGDSKGKPLNEIVFPEEVIGVVVLGGDSR